MSLDEKELRFLAWLRRHGADIDALTLSCDENGSRGAIATRDIASNEICMTIPSKLFISEASVKEDEILGPIFKEHLDLFTRDDPLLSTFLAYHLYLKERSFYHPYLSILPSPDSILNWTDDELLELQDSKLIEGSKRRNHEIQDWYNRIFNRLNRLHPDIFDEETFSYDNFRFGWQTVQARTFGRRLPWTALVPFADCLNHANVATKYDFNMDENQCFRWHSSQSHHCGQQVFNSYGRRANQQLLIDYGFALQKNEWDFVDLDIHGISFVLSKPEQRRLFLEAHLMPFPARIRLSPDTKLDEILPYFRCACLKEISNEFKSLLEIQEKSIENESFIKLNQQIEIYLNEFLTTIENDFIFLNQKNNSFKYQMALEYRWHRKFILNRIQILIIEKLKQF